MGDMRLSCLVAVFATAAGASQYLHAPLPSFSLQDLQSQRTEHVLAAEALTNYSQFTAIAEITTTVDGETQPAAVAGIDNNDTTWIIDLDKQVQLQARDGKSPFAPE